MTQGYPRTGGAWNNAKRDRPKKCWDIWHKQANETKERINDNSTLEESRYVIDYMVKQSNQKKL